MFQYNLGIMCSIQALLLGSFLRPVQRLFHVIYGNEKDEISSKWGDFPIESMILFDKGSLTHSLSHSLAHN
jgi:hypothetical protein